MGQPSIAFDPVADRYDATRGGDQRGRAFAATIAEAVAGRPGPVLEVGVGTGVVAAGLRDRLGVPVVGVDLSVPMLRHAVERLGHRVAVADGTRLPVGDGGAGVVVMVWLLHLVGDPVAVLAEARRALRPGGCVVVVPAGAHADAGPLPDLEIVERALGDACGRPSPDGHSALALDAAAAAGLRLEHARTTEPQRYEQSPAALAERYEERSLSWLWTMADNDFERLVAPGIAALRALPDPHRPRRRTQHHDALVLGAAPC